MATNKYNSDYPLPGGVEQYYDTLIELVQRVAAQPIAHDELITTISEVCSGATKANAIGTYIAVINARKPCSTNICCFTSWMRRIQFSSLAAQ